MYNYTHQQSRVAPEKADILTALTAEQMSISTGVSAMRAKFYYLQRQALSMLSLAIRHGDLTPPESCNQCGLVDDLIEGHHHDYSKPLEVTWLCRSCHKKAHFAGFDGHKKRFPVKLQDTIEWLALHPECANLTTRKLAGIIGVSHATVHLALKSIKKL